MQQTSPGTKDDLPFDMYCALYALSKKSYVNYLKVVYFLLGMKKLMQLPTFDSVHNVRYEAIPGQWSKGWQIISKLSPSRELRLFIKPHVAHPDNPLYHGVYHEPTQLYEYFIDGQLFGFGNIYLKYAKAEEENLNPEGRYIKDLSDSCITSLINANKRQVTTPKHQNMCLQECGYNQLSDTYKRTFDMLNDGNGGSESDLVNIIQMMRIMTSRVPIG